MVVESANEWAATIRQFPSTACEIDDAVDSYGLGHNTAAVFHLMRIAEYGLRALGHERQVKFPNKPLEWAEWQKIIGEIEKSVATTLSLPVLRKTQR
jgi:hypothetical protein